MHDMGWRFPASIVSLPSNISSPREVSGSQQDGFWPCLASVWSLTTLAIFTSSTEFSWSSLIFLPPKLLGVQIIGHNEKQQEHEILGSILRMP